MKRLFSYATYLLAFGLYSFFTLPFLLPKVETTSHFPEKDVVIVLGGGVNPDCTIGASVCYRVETGIQLFQLGKAKQMLFTGGPQRGSQNCVEAISMEAYALKRGIPSTNTLRESRALNTYQNAYYAIDLMQQQGFKSAYVVTSAFHTQRANLIFQQYDIDYQVIPSEDMSKGLGSYFALFKEQIILCFHTIFGIPDGFGLAKSDVDLVASLVQSN